MVGLMRNFVLAGGILAALAAGPAWAQDNFDAGKTPAQLYAADCAICHKTPHGLGKNGSESFLREHYTASREAARAIASYLRANGGGTLPSAKRAHPVKRAEKQKTKDGEPGAKKHDASKRDAHKPSDAKSTAKTGKEKTGKEKSGEAKRDAPKSGKPKSSGPKKKEAEDSKPKGNDAGKSGEPKAHTPKASEAKAKQADASKPKADKPTTNGSKPTASKKPAPKDVKPD